MPALSSIVPILPVHSMNAAADFYRSLGFTIVLYTGAQDYAFAHRDGLEMHLRQAPDLGHQSPSGVYFRLNPGTAKALEEAFRNAGVPILSPLEEREWGTLEFMISDPDHNLLRFGELLPTSRHPIS